MQGQFAETSTIMISNTNPVLPLLSTRMRFHSRDYRHPPITCRQRFHPYPQRTDSPPSRSTSNFSTGSFALIGKPKVNEEFLRSQEQQAAESNNTPTSELTPVTRHDGLIPKPAGEPGRNDGRGYNIADALKWTHEDMSRLKVSAPTLSSEKPAACLFLGHQKEVVYELAKRHLDERACFSNQNRNAVALVKENVSQAK